MEFIKHILARYTAFIWALLKPLGSWGIFGIAFIDSAAIGIPLDPVVVGYVWADKRHFWLYCVMAAAGSAAGSAILWYVGRKGGELLLEKRVSRQRLEYIREKFEKQEFLAMMVPSMLPPPTPFKLFILAAGAFDMKLRDFLLAVFLGRIFRFLIISALVIKFGPHVVNISGAAIREHFGVIIAVVITLAGAVIVYFMLRRRSRSNDSAGLPLGDEDTPAV